VRVQGFGEDYEKIYNAVRGLPVRACVVAFALRMGRRRCFACICVGDAQDLCPRDALVSGEGACVMRVYARADWMGAQLVKHQMDLSRAAEALLAQA
jgi:hypothetical protein